MHGEPCTVASGREHSLGVVQLCDEGEESVAMTGMVVSAVINVDPADAADDVPVSVQPAPSPSARTEDFSALIFSGERTTGSRVCQPGQDGRTHKAGRHPGHGRRLNAQKTMRAIQKTVIARDMR